MKRIRFLAPAFLMMLVLFFAACSAPPAETTTPPTNTPEPPTATATTESPTATAVTTSTVDPLVSPTSEPTATSTPTPVVYEAGSMPEDVNPLTGLVVDNPELLNRRPVSFKINIYPRDYYRPTIGLDAADLVFDYYHNDGYSRFNAIYYGNTASEVGPIRSGRLLDAKLMRMYKNFLAFGNADELILQQLTTADLYQRLLYATGYPCPATVDHPLCRWDPQGYDYLVGDVELIHDHMVAKGVDDSRQDLAGFSFAEQAPEGGESVTQIYTHYSLDDYNRWDYDPASGRYLRFQDAVYANGTPESYVPLTDRVDNQQISAANVVVLFARHEEVVPEPYGIYDVMLSGSGQAVVFRDGKMYEAAWYLPTPNSALSLTTPDGSPFYLKPGNTWFQVIGIYSTVKEDEPGVMRFIFSLY